MTVQSKCAKIKAKRDALMRKLEDSISANRPEHIEFIQKILERCLEQEKEIQKERKKRRHIGKKKVVVAQAEGDTGNDYFKRLPDEVLEIIVGKLESSADLQSLSNTCNLFRRILEPTRSTRLFDMILPHLETHLLPYQIKKCRYVCIKWRNGVDEWILNSSKHLYSPILTSGKFPKAIMENEKNPIFGRKLTLSIFDEPEEGDLIALYYHNLHNISPLKAIQFLERFGEHFWNAKLSYICPNKKIYFETIQSCLENLGNVRNLIIDGYGYDSGPKYDADLNQCLVKNPFPVLPCLVSLNLEGVDNLFFKHVFPIYCQQLNKLHIYLEPDRNYYVKSPPPLSIFKSLECPLRLENLTELVWHQGREMAPSTLLSLECPNLKIFKLILRKSCARKNNIFEMRLVFEILKHFGTNLHELELELGTNLLVNDLEPPEYFKSLSELQLTLVEKFKLSGWTKSLDILLCMPSLQYLFVNWASDGETINRFPAEEDEAVIEIQKYVGKTYQSNIWAVIPSLKEIMMTFVPLTVASEPRKSTYGLLPWVHYRYYRKGYEDFLIQSDL